MDRLKGLGSFLVISAVLFLGLRGAHLLVGAIYPASLPGPFQLDSLDDIEQYAGFSPHIPFYRPIELGAGPSEIVVERRPRPASRIVWRGESYLEIFEWSGGSRPAVAADATSLPDLPSSLYWEEGEQLVAVVQLAGRWVEVRTDLDAVQLRRIVDTLLPHDRLI